MLSNYIYVGSYQHKKRIKDEETILFEDVCHAFETTFLESVKCYPLERKNLKICSSNCKNIMLEQLRILSPKLLKTHLLIKLLHLKVF